MRGLPEYNVRVSARARNVSLRVLADGGLEVVVPRGFDERLVPEIVRQKRDWWQHHAERARERQRQQAAEPLLPERIALRAVSELWRVVYERAATQGVTLQVLAAGTLRLRGRVDDVALCREALERWLRGRARQALVPALSRLSQQHGLPFQRAAIRAQRTRWASCSARGTVSMNARLLFLPPALVRYVLVHELCHLRHMDHSPAFWALVGRLLPDAESCRRALRTAARYVPRWCAPEG